MIRIENYEAYKDRLHRVLAVTHLNESLFVLRLERKGMDFLPGQFIVLGIPGGLIKREYSIYSGLEDDFLEVLIREVPDGDLTPRLKQLQPGEELVIDGPAGDFLLPEDFENNRFLLVASGTGLSPFHSFIRSYKNLEYSLLFGIRDANETFLLRAFEKARYRICLSRGTTGDYPGYVTNYLKENPVKGFDYAYLCGNGNMVYDAFNILASQGIQRENIFAEIFF